MKLTDAIQESLVALILYNPEAAPIVRSLVPIEAYGSYFRDFAEEGLNYYSQFNKPAGEHTLDIYNSLCARRKHEADAYKLVFESIVGTKDSINAEYVIKQAELFARYSRINQTIGDALEILKKPVGDADLTVIENTFSSHHERINNTVDPGTVLKDKQRSLAFLRADNLDAMPTGIGPIDRRNLGPRRKTMWMIMANTGRGKTWCCCHLVKHCGIMARNRTLVISVGDMSEEAYLSRLMMNLFAVKKRPQMRQKNYIKFKRDESGMVCAFDEIKVSNRPSYTDQDIEKYLSKKIDGIPTPVIVKNFPAGTMTTDAIEGYIESLQYKQKFIPDLTIIDYADKFKYDSRHERSEIAGIYMRLHGMAHRRNLALVTPTQANRSGEDVSTLRHKHMGFAYEKAQISDVCFAYNQTKMEKARGLARLGCLKGRDEEDGIDIMISQNYAIGQFCLDAVIMNPEPYFEMVKNGPAEE